MNYRTIIILSLFLFAELLLFYFYQITEPNCVPCAAGEPCPPCISETQIILKWVMSVIFVIAIGIGILAFNKMQRKQSYKGVD